MMAYKSITDSKPSIVKKTFKEYDYCTSTKENRNNIYGKFI